MIQSARELFIIKILLAKYSNCADAYEITEHLNRHGYVSSVHDTIKALSKLAKQNVIVRRWLRTGSNIKIRIYCLNR